MINLINAELYKLRNRKSFKVILLLTLFPILWGLIRHIVKPDGMEVMSFISTYVNDVYYGFTINDFNGISTRGFMIDGILNAQSFLFSAVGSTPILFIFVVYFIGNIIVDEYTDKTIMHKISYGEDRKDIYMSKLITAIVGGTIIILLPMLINFAIGGFMYGFEGFDIVKVIKFFSVYMLLMYASISFLVLIANTARIKSELMGIGFIVLFTPAFLTDKTLNLLTRYTSFGGIFEICSSYPSDDTIIHLSIIGIVSIVLTTVLGIFIMKKRDIK